MERRIGKSILIVGSGGREHAIAWKLDQDARKNGTPIHQHFAPGNGGTADLGRNLDIDIMDIDRQINYARDNGIEFVIYGPEAPLIAGAVDAMTEAGIRAFGPSKQAAMLEGSKIWATEIMEKYDIPHPESESFASYDAALDYVSKYDPTKIVIKADGQALGKGVVLPRSPEEARETILDFMVRKSLREAGERVLIQKRLEGQEVSVIAFMSNQIGLLVPARDYKRAYDGDAGPNTGGMGGYAPNENLSRETLYRIHDVILRRTQFAMRSEGIPYRGVLYAGIMLTDEGPKVLEFNVRMGDPEAQLQLPRLITPLLPAMEATMRETLDPDMVRSDSRASVGVVVASNGYPVEYRKGKPIYISEDLPPEVVVLQAGTVIREGKLITNGGRLLTVVASGDTVDKAGERVYSVLDYEEVKVEGSFYRRDIAS